MKKSHWSSIGLALVIALMLWNRASAAGPPEDGPSQDGDRQVGLMSTRVEYLFVPGGMLNSAAGTVRLEWEGQVEQAFLVLSASGSQAGHSIYVNGRRVAQAPVRPDGRARQTGSSAPSLTARDFIPIPPEALIKGDNVITLTNDANFRDGWTAANLHIEIHGALSGPPVAALEQVQTALSPQAITAGDPISSTVWLTSSYELAQGEVVSQLVSYQIPASYTETISVPLLIGIHGLTSSGGWMRDFLAPEANERGWLLAAPDMHGRYYQNTGEYALAYVGAQHDIIDTVEYMTSHYNVDTSRIYVFGSSMGGQIATVMAAKYPDLFAAISASSSLTDLEDWYDELGSLSGVLWVRDVIENETGGTPSEAPFEYQRRSAMWMPQNSRSIPLHMWHNESDLLVDVHHSLDLADAIDGWNPTIAVTVTTVVSAGCTDEYKHCYDPGLDDVFDYLSGFATNSQPPLSLTLRTDESKPYYWLNFAQTGGDHWSEVEAMYSPADEAMTVNISDTQPLSLGVNLGSIPITGTAGLGQSGLGLPATTYLVNGGGNYELVDYTSGYLTISLSTTGQSSLTISALTAELSANPAMVSGWHTTTSTVTAMFRDHLDNPVPDGTSVQFSATAGTFPNARSTFTQTVSGGQGMITTTLTLTPTAGPAEIIASVESITGATSITAIYPAIDVRVTPTQPFIYSERSVTLTYQLTNTGDAGLTGVTLIDDNGTPGISGDDITICTDVTLETWETATFRRSTSPEQDATHTATVTGQDPLGNDVTDVDATTVQVISPTIALSVESNETIIYSQQVVTYTYQLTNTGDVTLTNVTLVDDSGTPGDSGDDITICTNVTLSEHETATFRRGTPLEHDTTSTAIVTGQDPLNNDVTDDASTTVQVISPTIALSVKPNEAIIYSEQIVTYTYQLTNTGNVTLTGVTLVDDNGTPGDSGDDIILCANVTLAAKETATFRRSPTVFQTITITATVTGQDPLGNDVTDEASATVSLQPWQKWPFQVYVPVVARNH